MQRGLTGRYEVTTTGDEAVHAFLPDPLPPKPPLAWDGKLLRALEKADIAVGRLDGVKSLLPNRAYFLYSYVRKEAVLSSQIEGTQSSLSDLLRFELNEAPGVPLDDIIEVRELRGGTGTWVEASPERFPTFQSATARNSWYLAREWAR